MAGLPKLPAAKPPRTEDPNRVKGPGPEIVDFLNSTRLAGRRPFIEVGLDTPRARQDLTPPKNSGKTIPDGALIKGKPASTINPPKGREFERNQPLDGATYPEYAPKVSKAQKQARNRAKARKAK